MKKLILQSLSVLFMMSSCCSVPFPLSTNFIKSELPSAGFVNHSLLVRFQNRESRTKTVSFMQLIETNDTLSFKKNNIFISGTNQHFKMYIGRDHKWKKTDEVMVTSKSVLYLRFKCKKKVGETIRIVEKNLNSRGDSIAINIRIPVYDGEWYNVFKKDNDNMYSRIYNSF